MFKRLILISTILTTEASAESTKTARSLLLKYAQVGQELILQAQKVEENLCLIWEEPLSIDSLNFSKLLTNSTWELVTKIKDIQKYIGELTLKSQIN